MLLDGLRQEALATLDERVDRYLSVRRLALVPNHYYSGVSAECQLLFRDGYFLACVSLCQSVAEALSQYLCRAASIRSRGRHPFRVARLAAEQVVSDEAKHAFDQIHEHRDDIHHLNPGAPTDRIQLERIAIEALSALARIEQEVFAFSVVDGRVCPANPRFWKTPAV